MRLAALDVTAQLLTEFVHASKYRGLLPRAFFVKQNPLPDDTEVIAVRGTESSGVIRLILKSDSFADVPDGAAIPQVPQILYETVYGQTADDVFERIHDATILDQDFFDY